MILDSSALVAIVLDEPERESMLAKIAAADMVAVAAPTLLEAGIVLSARLGFDALDILRGLLQAADAVTILDQIEGAIAYLDTVGTRAEDRVYKRMRLALESAHRSLHNRMHQQGHYHEHALAPTREHGARHKGS